MTYRDMTFCSSRGCKNKCGRKLSEEERSSLPKWELVSMSEFCNLKGELLINENIRGKRIV